MRMQLVSNNIVEFPGEIQPNVYMEENVCHILLDSEDTYSYVIYTEYDTIVTKGRFQKSVNIDMSILNPKNKYQLKLFNLDSVFTYRLKAAI
ncbi:MAG: hypothetical protein H3C31_09995 [Brumimicrobium sp.]|nr:hypothetical protein [Brumimicrobium sp.]MCO5269586.1 hypothetical protein [Brumimicrobium sp.]